MGVHGADLGGAGCGLGGAETGGAGLLGGGLGFGGEDFPPHLDLLQSTGRLTTGKHVLADFWFGLSDKQLLLSSRVTSVLEDGTHDGASPLKKLYENLKFAKLGSLQIPSRTNPVSVLWETSRYSTFFIPEKLFCKTPVNELECAENTVALPSIPISFGKQPPKSLFEKTISFKVFPILPMLFGMHPVNLLLAKTTTEAVDSPRVSGICPVNRLLFTNRASSSFSNTSSGRLPSKSLNLMSKYLRAGNDRTTLGKAPTNRLLLTSNSCMRSSLEKLLGMIPQNRFELI